MSLSQNEANLASLSRLDDWARGRRYAFVSSRTEPAGRDEAPAVVSIGRALAVYHLDRLIEYGHRGSCGNSSNPVMGRAVTPRVRA